MFLCGILSFLLSLLLFFHNAEWVCTWTCYWFLQFYLSFSVTLLHLFSRWFFLFMLKVSFYPCLLVLLGLTSNCSFSLEDYKCCFNDRIESIILFHLLIVLFFTSFFLFLDIPKFLIPWLMLCFWFFMLVVLSNLSAIAYLATEVRNFVKYLIHSALAATEITATDFYNFIVLNFVFLPFGFVSFWKNQILPMEGLSFS